MDINKILSKLPANKPLQNNGRTIQQTLLLLCLEKQIIRNDIALQEQNLTQETEDLLEYKKIWLNCWLKKRSLIFKDYLPLNIMELDINITELYKSIQQNIQQTNPMWKISIYQDCVRFEGYAFQEFTAFDKDTVFFKKWLKNEYSSIKLDDNAKAQSLERIVKLLEIAI